MKGFLRTAIFLAIFSLPVVLSARHIGRQPSYHGNHHQTQPSKKDVAMMVKPNLYSERRRPMKHKGPDTLQIAGSSLPDCSHACGSCTPCRLVMVSFVCASIEEAETCPMAYKCMCNNKSYPVP